MPFTAEVSTPDGWRRIAITDYESPKNALFGQEIRCQDPDCQAPFIIKQGLQVTPHFAHAAGTGSPRCIYSSNGGESEQHRLAKVWVLRRCQRWPLYKGAAVELERILTGFNKKRIADIAVTFPDGAMEIHEVQLARTTIQECSERTRDYQMLGADAVCWWFGGDNEGDSALYQWAQSECNGYGELHFVRRVVEFDDPDSDDL